MLVLGLDTATPAVTAGLAHLDLHPGQSAGPGADSGGGPAVSVLAERATVDPRAHGELLMPQIRQVAAAAGVRLSSVEAVVCGAGPGPYTGLRAGMVTAAALAHSLGVPAYPVLSLDAIAAQVAAAQPGTAQPGTAQPRTAHGDYLVVTDARRSEVYWARYSAEGTRVGEPAVDRPDEVPLEGVTAVAGHGGAQYADVFAGPMRRVIEPAYPGVLGLLRVAAPSISSAAISNAAHLEAPAPLVPRYLRVPHAAVPGERKRVSR